MELKEQLLNANDYDYIQVGRNRIYKERELFVVEQYEYTDNENEDWYSTYDGYLDVDEAIRIARKI